VEELAGGVALDTQLVTGRGAELLVAGLEGDGAVRQSGAASGEDVAASAPPPWSPPLDGTTQRAATHSYPDGQVPSAQAKLVLSKS
jgi:hypothetical protein